MADVRAGKVKERKKPARPFVKPWLFPKAHMHSHSPSDIRRKGVTLNYNTKPNEKMHGKLKEWYLRRTNYKNVEDTVRSDSSRFSHQRDRLI